MDLRPSPQVLLLGTFFLELLDLPLDCLGAATDFFCDCLIVQFFTRFYVCLQSLGILIRPVNPSFIASWPWILGFIFFRIFFHNRLTEAFPIGLGIENFIF